MGRTTRWMGINAFDTGEKRAYSAEDDARPSAGSRVASEPPRMGRNPSGYVPPGNGGWGRPPSASFSPDTETDRHKILPPFLGRVRTTCPGGRRCALGPAERSFPSGWIDPTTTCIVRSRGSEEIVQEVKKNDRELPTGAKSTAPKTIRARPVLKRRAKYKETVRIGMKCNATRVPKKKIRSNQNSRVRTQLQSDYPHECP